MIHQKTNGNYFVSTINELHMLCINTTDHTICTKIQRIEELTAKIFRTVEEHPEKKAATQAFFKYLSADDPQIASFI